MPSEIFRYPYPIRETLEPWREKLGTDEFETVVELLVDRDQELEDCLTSVKVRHAARLSRTTNVVAGASPYTIVWNFAEYQDDADSVDIVGAPTLYTVLTDGLYEAHAQVRLNSNEIDNTFTNVLDIVTVGSLGSATIGQHVWIERGNLIVTDDYTMQVTTTQNLRAGDILRVDLTHSNAQAPDILGDASPTAFSFFTVRRVGPRTA